MKNTSVRFFPFSPGIPWKMKRGKYVMPEVQGAILDHHIKDKDLVIAAFGGLLESFYSFSILEMINFHRPGHKMLWAGDKRFQPLLRMNALSSGMFKEVDEATMDRFPTPLFLDKENRAYFNSLVNYINVKTYYQTKGYIDKRPAFEQIRENGLFQWDDTFIPSIRSNSLPQKLISVLALEKFDLDKPYALIVPTRTGFSRHKASGLSWNIPQVRAFCTLLYQKGVKPVILSNERSFYSKEAILIPFNIEYFAHLAQRARAILSEEVDFLLVGDAIASNSKIISRPQKGALDTIENNALLGGKNVIYVREELTPIKAVNLVIKK